MHDTPCGQYHPIAGMRRMLLHMRHPAQRAYGFAFSICYLVRVLRIVLADLLVKRKASARKSLATPSSYDWCMVSQMGMVYMQILEGKAYPSWMMHLYLHEIAFARSWDHFFGPQASAPPPGPPPPPPLSPLHQGIISTPPG